MSYRTYRSSGYGLYLGECTPFGGGEFDLKWRIPFDLHGMFSLWANVPEAIRRSFKGSIDETTTESDKS